MIWVKTKEGEHTYLMENTLKMILQKKKDLISMVFLIATYIIIEMFAICP